MKSKSPSQGWVLREATEVYMVHATVLFVRCSYSRACSSLMISPNFMSHFDDRFPGRFPHFSWQVPLKPGKSHEMQSIHLLHGVLSKTGHVRRCVVICPSIVVAFWGRVIISVPFDPGHFHYIRQSLERIWAVDSWLVWRTCWKVQGTRAGGGTGREVFPRCVLSYVQTITATFSLSSWHM